MSRVPFTNTGPTSINIGSAPVASGTPTVPFRIPDATLEPFPTLSSGTTDAVPSGSIGSGLRGGFPVGLVINSGPWMPEHGTTFNSLHSSAQLIIDERLILFHCEMNMQETERGLLENLRADPNNKHVRNLYTDFLLDCGRTISAEMVRNGWTPGGSSR